MKYTLRKGASLNKIVKMNKIFKIIIKTIDNILFSGKRGGGSSLSVININLFILKYMYRYIILNLQRNINKIQLYHEIRDRFYSSN